MFGDLPDWSRPLREGPSRAYANFALGGAGWLLPDALQLGLCRDGSADFRLRLMRKLDNDASLGVGGTLDLGVRASYAQAEPPLQPAPISRALLSLRASGLPDAPTTLLGEACETRADGLHRARLLTTLSADAASIVERLLAGGVLALQVVAEVEIEGFSPRLARVARIDVDRFIAALRILADPMGRVRRSVLLSALDRDRASLGIALLGAADDPAPPLLAETLLDHLRVCLLRLVLTPFDDLEPALALAAQASEAPRTLQLDLAQPLIAPRPLLLTLNPFSAAAQLNASGSLEGVVTRVRLPTLQLGFHRIWVHNNVSGVEADEAQLLTTLRFPARPPLRPGDIVNTIEHVPNERFSHCDVRLAPGEALEWECSTSVLLPLRGRLIRLVETALPGRGERVLVSNRDLPARLYSIEAEPALLALADVELALGWSRAGIAFERSCRLDGRHPQRTLVVPRDASDVLLSVVARSRRDSSLLHLTSAPVGDRHLTLANLPGYGAQRVEVSLQFDQGSTLAAIDFLPMDATDDAAIQTLAFTPADPIHEVRWLCTDPFRAGVRWRWHANAGESMQPWSAPCAAGSPLALSLTGRRLSA